MAITDYRDFDLLITRAGDQYRAFVVTAPAGEASVTFPPPFAPDELPQLGGLIDVRRHTGLPDDTGLAPDLTDLGRRLFEAIFQPSIYACFREQLADALEQNDGLRLRLRIAPNIVELHDLPWEYLYNPSNNRFLAFSTETPVTRYLEMKEPVIPRSATLPLRVLVMVASPKDLEPLDVEDEWDRLQKAFAPLVECKRVAI